MTECLKSESMTEGSDTSLNELQPKVSKGRELVPRVVSCSQAVEEISSGILLSNC